MGFIDILIEWLLRLVIYCFRSLLLSAKREGTGSWVCSQATVTAEPVVARGLGCPMVEVVYSYRFQGEPYTGLHEEPFFSDDSLKEYVVRFASGRTFVVRLNPDKPDHSTIREQDQVIELAHS